MSAERGALFEKLLINALDHSFDGGSVACLSWYGQGLAELWQTNLIDGYVADYFFDEDTDQNEIKGRVLNRLYVAQLPPVSILNRIISGVDSKLLAYEIAVKKVEEDPPRP